MKTLLIITALLSLAACSTTGPDPATNARNARINATASYAFQKTLDVAFSTVISAAVSASDAQAKGNYLDGLASGFRAQEGELLTAADVQTLVGIWTPSAPHWTQLGAQLATVYATANPQTPQAAKAVLESIASGLNSTASTATP